MKKNMIMGLAAFLAVICFTGCAKKAGSDEVILTESEPIVIAAEPEPIVLEDETEEETKPEPEVYEPWERLESDGMVRSYLTGEMVPAAQGNRRPLAIMMSNDKESLPQYGINRAGVVYEAPVEGAMNRYMAIMENYDDLDRIGSVRSCRTYYTYFAREFDAIYAHCGQSTFAKPYLKNVDNINGVEGIGNTEPVTEKDLIISMEAMRGFKRRLKSWDILRSMMKNIKAIIILQGKAILWY